MLFEVGDGGAFEVADVVVAEDVAIAGFVEVFCAGMPGWWCAGREIWWRGIGEGENGGEEAGDEEELVVFHGDNVLRFVAGIILVGSDERVICSDRRVLGQRFAIW